MIGSVVGHSAIALLGFGWTVTAAPVCTWTKAPPTPVNEATQAITGLSITCTGVSAQTNAILTSDIDTKLSLSVPLSNGAAVFPSFTLLKGETKTGGTQTLTVTINGVAALTGKTYLIPQQIDIGFLANFDVPSGWMDHSFQALVFSYVLNQEKFLLNTQIKVDVKPSNCSVTISAASTFAILSNPDVLAIWGPDCSGTAMVDSPMAAAFGVPVVSGTNGNPTLSDKSVYKMYMRTITNNNGENLFLLSMIQYYGWKYVNIITFDYLPFGDFMYAALSQLNVTVSALPLGMFDKPYVWLFANPSGDDFQSTSIIPDTKKAGHIYFARTPPPTNMPWREKVAALVNNDTWVSAMYGPAYLTRTKPVVANNLDQFGLWNMNAYLTIIVRISPPPALRNLIYVKQVDFDGMGLYQEMRKIDIIGMEGPLAFDANGDGYNVPAAGIMWVAKKGWTTMGDILPVTTSAFLQYTPINKNLVWPGNSTQPPTGLICDHECGHGACTRPGTCICEPGWVQDKTLFLSGGPDCTIAICKACQNGQCVSPNVCQCNPNWIGSDCSILSLPMQQTSFSSPDQVGSQVVAIVNLVILGLTIISAIFLTINRNNKQFRSLDISFTGIQLIGIIIGHVGLIFSTAGPTDINCSMILQMTALLLKTYRFYTIFDSTNPSAKGNLQFWKLGLVIAIFFFITMIMCIVWAAGDQPYYTVLKNVDGINFYGACKSLSNGAGYAAVVILGLLFGFVSSVMIVLSAYADNKLVLRYAICTIFFSIVMVVVQFQNFNEVTKTIIVNAVGILNLQAGHYILVVPRYLKAAKKMSVGSSQTSSSNQGEDTAESGAGFSPVSKSTSDMVLLQVCHLKPGLLSRWVKKMGMYDRRNNILMVQAASSETQPHTPMDAFLLNVSHSKIVDVDIPTSGVLGSFSIECGNILHQFQLAGTGDEKVIQDFAGLLKSLKNSSFTQSSMAK
ncbi:periplasmic binding protein-like I [Obelidium mucronatum]|nr:periplasmic binding protein-like I [Obelidium mucronatum]